MLKLNDIKKEAIPEKYKIYFKGTSEPEINPALKNLPSNYSGRPLYNRISSCDIEVHDSLDREISFFNFSYTVDDETYIFDLPVFKKLEDVTTNSVSNIKVADKNNHGEEYSYKNRLKQFLYKPIALLAPGFKSVANVFNIALAIYEAKFMKLGIVYPADIFVYIFRRVTSLLYIIPALKNYYNREILKNELLDIFNKVMININSHDYDSAQLIFKNLEFKYKVFLYPSYPDNDNLRWNYYYMNDLINENEHSFHDCKSYNIALKLSYTPDEKFLVLQGLLNVYDWHYENDVKWLNKRNHGFFSTEDIESLKTSKMNVARITAPYIAQIATDSPMHQQLREYLHLQLQRCITEAVQGEFDAAKKIFDEINFNGYCKKAYPAAAIIYYQLQTILTLVMGFASGIDTFWVARENLLKIQEYFDKNYSKMSFQHQKYFDLFDSSVMAIKVACNRPPKAMKFSETKNYSQKKPTANHSNIVSLSRKNSLQYA